jgi:hypothetical protein
LQDSLKRKLATKESVVKMVEQEFKKNAALLSEKADKVSELEATVQKQEQEVERLTREVRLAKSSEASDEVVERLKKEKDELRKIAAAMETRYKELLLLETERSEKRRRKLLKYYNLYLEQKVRKIFI